MPGVLLVYSLQCATFGGIHERLLVDTSHTFQIAHAEGILRPRITRMCRLDLTAGLVIVRFFLQRRDLSVSQYDTLSGDFLLKGLLPPVPDSDKKYRVTRP